MEQEMSTNGYAEYEEYFEYLDGLRECGTTNMFGAGPYLQESFGVSRQEATSILAKWMDTFTERHAND